MPLMVSFLLLIVSILLRCSLVLHEVRSNSAFINRSFSISIILALSTYIFSINMSESSINHVGCTTIAVLVYFFFLATVTWHCMGSLHIYRRITDARNMDSGPSTQGSRSLYFLIGWFLPMICVGLSFGLKSDIFGNASFCWLSWKEDTVWAIQAPNFIIPILDLLLIFICWLKIVSHKPTVNIPDPFGNLNPPHSPLKVPIKTIQSSKTPLHRQTVTWVFTILIWYLCWVSVNQNNLINYIIIVILITTYSIIDFLYVFYDEEVRKAWKLERSRKERKKTFNSTTAALLTHAVAYTNSTNSPDNSIPSRVETPTRKPLSPKSSSEGQNHSLKRQLKLSNEQGIALENVNLLSKQNGNFPSNPASKQHTKSGSHLLDSQTRQPSGTTKGNTSLTNFQSAISKSFQNELQPASSVTSDISTQASDIREYEGLNLNHEVRRLQEINRNIGMDLLPEKNNSKISWGESKTILPGKNKSRSYLDSSLSRGGL